MSSPRGHAPSLLACLILLGSGPDARAADPPPEAVGETAPAGGSDTMSVEPDQQTIMRAAADPDAPTVGEPVPDPDADRPMSFEPGRQTWAGPWDLRLPGAEPATGDAAAAGSGVVIKKEWKNKLDNTDDTGRFWVQDTWNLEVEALVGPSFERKWPFPFAFTARIRAGALLIREPMFWNVGAFADYSTWDEGAFGVMGEVMHFTTGTWAQLSAFIDTDARMGFGVGGGWSLFGGEIQMRHDPGRDLPVWSVHAKVRIPIRMFLFAAGI